MLGESELIEQITATNVPIDPVISPYLAHTGGRQIGLGQNFVLEFFNAITLGVGTIQYQAIRTT